MTPTLDLILLLMLLSLLSKLANYHVALSKNCISLRQNLILLKLYHLLLMWGWEIILTRWVRSYWDSILLHGLHTIISSASCSRINLRWALTSSNLSLLSCILERSSCSDLTWSVLLLSTCSYSLLARLALRNLIEWTHRPLTLSVVSILTEKSIQILRCCTWSSALWLNSLDFTLFIWEFSSTTWLLAAASTSWLEKTTLCVIISCIKQRRTT